MAFIDIHTHKEAREEGVIKVQNIFPGEGFAAFSGCNYYSVGLHPWHVKSPEENKKELALLENALFFEHVLSVGECGLDKPANTDFKEQVEVFSEQVELSEKFKKPVVIHSVKAIDEILKIRVGKKAQQPWVMHGFNGNAQMAKQLLGKGFLFSFGGVLFNEGAKSIEAFKSLPLEYIFFETDELDCSIEDIYKKAAEIKELDIYLLKAQVEENFNNIFKKG